MDSKIIWSSALLHIGSRLFELFSKEVRVKKQPGRPLNICPNILPMDVDIDTDPDAYEDPDGKAIPLKCSSANKNGKF